MYIIGYFLMAVAKVLDIVLIAFMWIVIARALLSWVNPDPFNPIVRFIHNATEPILYPILESQIENPFNLEFMPEPQILTGLKDGSLEMGFLSPYSYAQNQGEFRIVTDFVIHSRQTGKNALVYGIFPV